MSNEWLNVELFNATLIDLCISKLNPDKAPGFDKLCVQHLTKSHPSLYVILARLFFFNVKIQLCAKRFWEGYNCTNTKRQEQMWIFESK